MALQFHGVMKEAQDLDHVTVRRTPDAEHDEMATLAALRGDVKREKPLQDVVPLFCTDGGRTGGSKSTAVAAVSRTVQGRAAVLTSCVSPAVSRRSPYRQSRSNDG